MIQTAYVLNLTSWSKNIFLIFLSQFYKSVLSDLSLIQLLTVLLWALVKEETAHLSKLRHQISLEIPLFSKFLLFDSRPLHSLVRMVVKDKTGCLHFDVSSSILHIDISWFCLFVLWVNVYCELYVKERINCHQNKPRKYL